MDARTFEIHSGSRMDSLTASELKLLQYFHAHPGEVLSRDRLLNEVWGHGYFGTTRTLDQVIAQLRRKLGEGSPPQHRSPSTASDTGWRKRRYPINRLRQTLREFHSMEP